MISSAQVFVATTEATVPKYRKKQALKALVNMTLFVQMPSAGVHVVPQAAHGTLSETLYVIQPVTTPTVTTISNLMELLAIAPNRKRIINFKL